MMCNGCLLNEKQKQQAIESAAIKAKAYAIEIKKMVVLYWVNETTVSWMEAGPAKINGIVPIKFISYLQQTADG